MPHPRISPAIIALAVLSIGAPQVAGAQGSTHSACEPLGHSRPGDWAEYEVRSAGQSAGEPADRQPIHFAVVGTGAAPGQEGLLRYEMTMPTGREPMIVQFLAPRFPFELSEVQAIVIKAGSRPAIDVPPAMLEILRRQAGATPLTDLAAACAAARIVERGEITVPAGTFSATHLRGPETTEAWVSRRVPFGLLRGVDRNGSEIRLVRFGAGATSSLGDSPSTPASRGSRTGE